MRAPNIERKILELLVILDLPVSAEEDADGWSAGSKKAAADYFSNLRTCIAEGNSLPPLGIVRGLDHWGVTGGNLLERIAGITNELRAE